jgi:uncharacterized protein (TIGR00369 family)
MELDDEPEDTVTDMAATALQMMPFARTTGIEIEAADAHEVRGTLAWDEQRCTSGGVLHGGAIMTLADTLGAVCAFLNIPQGASTTTVESATRFFRAVRSGSAHATARPLHAGRRFVTVQTDVHDDEGKLVAQVTQTQAVL